MKRHSFECLRNTHMWLKYAIMISVSGVPSPNRQFSLFGLSAPFRRGMSMPVDLSPRGEAAKGVSGPTDLPIDPCYFGSPLMAQSPI